MKIPLIARSRAGSLGQGVVFMVFYGKGGGHEEKNVEAKKRTIYPAT